ncbi:MAG: sel1 repeat family protein [Acidobacteria bacterium]|nr:sel1 repeat family protein [Acidobacteriota bacterium]
MKTSLRAFVFSLLIVSAQLCAFAQKEKSLANYLDDAKGGDADAQNEVGVIYAEGLGVKRNDREGVKWFRMSADQGNVYGACNLALHYGRGDGMRKDLTMMMKWAFIAHSLRALRCHPEDFVALFKPSKSQINRGWNLAIAWLRAHPELDNNFDERPWLGKGDWPETFREHGPEPVPALGRKKPRR